MGHWKHAITASLLMFASVVTAGQAAPENSLARQPVMPVIASQSAGAPIWNPADHRVGDSAELTKKGLACAQSGAWGDAKAFYQQALALWPTNGQALYAMAACDKANGNLAGEVEDYRKAIYSTDPRDPRTPHFCENNATRLLEYVLVLSSANQNEEALAVYHHAAPLLNIRDGRPYLRVALPEFASGQTGYTPQRLQAMAHVGISADAQDEKIKEDQARQALALCPNLAIAYYYLGDAFLRTNPAEARTDYNRAIQLGDQSVIQGAKNRLEVAF